METESVKSLSAVWLFTTPWTIACQALLSMEVSRQDYWSGLPCPSPGNLLDPGTEHESPALQVDSLLRSAEVISLTDTAYKKKDKQMWWIPTVNI